MDKTPLCVEARAASGFPLTVPCGLVWPNEQEKVEAHESASLENKKGGDEAEFVLGVAVGVVAGGAGLGDEL